MKQLIENLRLSVNTMQELGLKSVSFGENIDFLAYETTNREPPTFCKHNARLRIKKC